jgi:hypothetical protein
MKRLLAFAAFVVVAVATSKGLLAQNNPFVGTWKLKPAKSSKVTSETLTFQMVGEQRQFTLNGTWADGSPISIKYETPDKGGAGKILEGPFDAVSGKRIDENTYETSLMKGGKEISHHHLVVSKDGKTMKVTGEATDAHGKPVSGVEVFEKQ